MASLTIPKKLDFQKAFPALSIFIMISLFSTGCMMPSHLKVRSGIDPDNQDEDVRFRTTYYFRVFDRCSVKKAKKGDDEDKEFSQDYPPFITKDQDRVDIQNDSLYRFRMTGKGNSLYNKIRFESGTLSKWEIDPFGATIKRDETGRPSFEPQSDKNNQSRKSKSELAIGDAEKWIDIQKKLLDGKLLDLSPDDFKEARNERLNTTKEVEKAIRSLLNPNCPGGIGKRGFQILGPEGWRTFDQDERLIMAMSSSGQPLISALKELSGRMLKETPSQDKILFPLVKERLTVSHTEERIRNLGTSGASQSSKSMVEAIITEFNKDHGIGGAQ